AASSTRDPMKTHKPIFIILILGIPILLLSAVFVWKPWKPSGELSKRELIALTNAVRVVSTKPILGIRFSDSDESAYVMNDSITDSVGHVEEFGLIFKRRLFGWRFITKSPQLDPQEYRALIEGQREAARIQNNLMVGTEFPVFDEKDVMGQPLSTSSLRGKVVLIDFWATWCVPCCAEIPNVVATFQKYHDQGFEIIGVSLDNDRQKLLDYTLKQKMTWQEYFDG